jgi:succinoglycan biosynthesis transport protein ExoP
MNKPQYLLEGSGRSEPDSALSVSDMLGFFNRRRTAIIVTFSIVVLACLAWCIVGTKMYVASGKIQIEKEDSDDFGLKNTVSGATNADSDALDYNVTLETQANILTSETLALQVSRELNLENTNDYTGANSWLHIPRWMKPWEPKVEAANVPLEDAPIRRYKLLKEFKDRLDVETVSGTRLITIKYESSDPKLAANVVNDLIRDYQAYTFQSRYTVTAQVSSWLTTQLSDLKSQTQDLETKAVQAQRETGIFGLGNDDDHNVVLSKLEALNVEANEAESSRILKEAIYHAVQSGSPDEVTNLAGNTASPIPPSTMTLVDSLRMQETTLQSQLSQMQQEYGSAYPKVAETQSQLQAVQAALNAELARVTQRARSDYEIATEQAGKARQNFEAQKRLALDSNDKTIQFALAKQEADDSRNLYADLLKKLKEAGVLQGLKSTNIAVVDPAGIPARPKMPYAPVDLPIAAVAGLFLGLLLAVFIDLTDKRVHNVEELEFITNAPVLGVLPSYSLRAGDAPPKRITLFPNLLGKGNAVLPIAAIRPDSPYVESVRALRTQLMHPRGVKTPQVIKVSSPLSGEGKSTLVMNLGTILARQGASVLLVDADFRSQHQNLDSMTGIPQQQGLSTLLLSDGETEPLLQTIDAIPGLHLLPSGPVPPYPAELLASSRMKGLMETWRSQFDFIILDSPPLLPVTDSMVLNQYTDFHALVVRFESTPKAAFLRSYQAVSRQAEAGTVGVVVNAFRQNSQEFEHYYGYKGHPYKSLSRRSYETAA